VSEEEVDYPLKGVLEEEGLKILDHIQDVDLDPDEVNILWTHPTPLDLSSAQRAVVIEKLRRDRKDYVKAKKEGKRVKKPVSTKLKSGLDLKDLNLDIGDLLNDL